MNPKKLNLLFLILLMTGLFSAQYTLHGQTTPNREQRVVTAVRLSEPVNIDGKLDEKAWRTAGISGFIQEEPDDGQPATDKTVVWVAYDNKAIYVAARMYDAEPGKIIALLGRRDDFVDSDWFLFSVDPYYDRLSGFQFAVTPRSSRVDWTIYNDTSRDDTWDGVWESKARIDDKGWTMEMRIPYDQLRFKKKDSYVWGVNFRRINKRKNELSGLVWKPKEETGFASYFARLEGIQDINPRRLVEVIPYAIGKAAFSTAEAGNPFETGEDFSADAGIDMKVGLKSNLTLDLTVNPDFGQVEVDPAVINLSAAENFYDEKRPFFMEGADIFRFGRGGSSSFIGADWGDPRFFYSRRIGRPPQGGVAGDGYVDYPGWTTILAAAKLTGKTGNGWNFGFLNAVTEREYARIDQDGSRSKAEVEPAAYYGVLRGRKEFNEGRQGLGFISTAVLRNLRTDNLESTLNKNAFSFALDGWTFLDSSKTWVLTGYFGGTRVTGSRERISQLQQSYPHYFQRPDAGHVTFDPDAVSMSGWAGRFTLNKQRGNFLFNAALGAISPGFNAHDMGFQWGSDKINGHVMIGYEQFKPGKLFRRWSTLLFSQRNYDFDGNKIGDQRFIFIGNAQLLNYWDLYLQISNNGTKMSREETRGGPLMEIPYYTWYDWNIGSDNRKSLVLFFGGFHVKVGSGSYTNRFGGGLRWKPGSNFNISVTPNYEYKWDAAQWVTNVEDPYMTATYGNRHIFAGLEQRTLSCSIRLNWIFSPTLSLQAYIQPFIAVGAYTGFKELKAPGTYTFNQYGETVGSAIMYKDGVYSVEPDGPGPAAQFDFNNPDFNYKSLRGTIVLRWEYRPGSTLYAVWTQNRADYADPGDFKFGRDIGNLFNASGDNIFMVKFTYRFKL